ncbi:MAG: hypothetical protein AAFU77_12365 [Myxococcota bacterium]
MASFEEYLLYAHRGVRCVSPASEVAAVHREPGELRTLSLWKGHGAGAGRFLQIAGEKWVVEVHQVRSVAREPFPMLTLPPVLKRELPTSIVGLVEIDDEPRWFLRLANVAPPLAPPR